MSNDGGRQELGHWLAILANAAVVAGIVFLAIEIRQNTAMIEAQITQSRADAASSFQESIYNSEFLPSILVKVENGEDLDSVEMRRYENYFRAMNRNFENQLGQYRRGFLGSNIPRSVQQAARLRIGGNPLGLRLWEQQKASYTDEYVEFVEEAIADPR